MRLLDAAMTAANICIAQHSADARNDAADQRSSLARAID